MIKRSVDFPLNLAASSTTKVTLPPGGRALVRTGLVVQLPPDAEAQVRPRSGLALKHGVTVINDEIYERLVYGVSFTPHLLQLVPADVADGAVVVYLIPIAFLFTVGHDGAQRHLA